MSVQKWAEQQSQVTTGRVRRPAIALCALVATVLLAGCNVSGIVISANGPEGDVAVQLYDENSASLGNQATPLAGTWTGLADGRYFLNAKPGCYRLVFVAPAGRRFLDGADIAERKTCVTSNRAGGLVNEPLWAPAPIVDNPSFERGVSLGEGQRGATPIPWTGGSGSYVPSRFDYPNGPADGTAVAFLDTSSTRPLSQQLGPIVGGATYRLSVAVGRRATGSGFSGATIELLAGSDVVASQTADPAPAAGAFRRVRIQWTSPAMLDGMMLSVRVRQTQPGSGRNADIDDVSLEVDAGFAGALLDVYEPARRQVLQRAANGTATIPVRGAVPAGVTADRVRVEVVDRGSSSVVAAAETPTWIRGLFATQVSSVPAGWYDLRVTALAGSNVVGRRVVQRIGVGEVYVAAGQSNSANHGEVPLAPSDERVSGMSAAQGLWRFAADPQPGATGTGGSPWPVFADRIVDAKDVPVGIVSVGVAATRADEWAPGGRYHSRLLSVLEHLGPDGFRAVLWHQGESDAQACTSAADYRRRMEAVIAASREAVGRQVVWGVATASNVNGSKIDDCRRAIRRVQGELQTQAGVFAGPDTDVYGTEGLTYDTVHFNAEGLRRHGREWADVVLGAGLAGQ